MGGEYKPPIFYLSEQMKKSETQVLEIAKKFFGEGLENPDVLVIAPTIGLARYAFLKHTFDQDPKGNEFMKAPLRRMKALEDIVAYAPCKVDGAYKCVLKKDMLFKSGDVKYYQFTKLCEYTSEVRVDSYRAIETALTDLSPGKKYNVVITDSEIVIADDYIYPNIKEVWAR